LSYFNNNNKKNNIINTMTVICLSACLLVTFVSPAKTAEVIEIDQMIVSDADYGEPDEPRITR